MQIYNIKAYAVGQVKSSDGDAVLDSGLCFRIRPESWYQRGTWSKPQALVSPAWSLFLQCVSWQKNRSKNKKIVHLVFAEEKERVDISLCFCFSWSRLDGALLHACFARWAPPVPAEASGNSGPSPQIKERLSEGERGPDLNFTPQRLHLLANWISLAVISVVKLLLLSFTDPE